MPVLTPPAALSEATFGRPHPLWARLWAPRRPQRSLNASILTSFWLLCRTCLGPADGMAPSLAPGAQNLSKMSQKKSLKATKPTPNNKNESTNFSGVQINFAVCSTFLLDPLRYGMIRATEQQVNIEDLII